VCVLNDVFCVCVCVCVDKRFEADFWVDLYQYNIPLNRDSKRVGVTSVDGTNTYTQQKMTRDFKWGFLCWKYGNANYGYATNM
jgi:hypothetical protein